MPTPATVATMPLIHDQRDHHDQHAAAGGTVSMVMIPIMAAIMAGRPSP